MFEVLLYRDGVIDGAAVFATDLAFKIVLVSFASAVIELFTNTLGFIEVVSERRDWYLEDLTLAFELRLCKRVPFKVVSAGTSLFRLVTNIVLEEGRGTRFLAVLN